MVNSVRSAQKTLTDDSFERFLSKSLESVEPNPEFVGHLRRRLAQKSEVQIEKSNWKAAYLVVAGGIFSGALVFWLLAQVFRGVRSLVWRKD